MPGGSGRHPQSLHLQKINITLQRLSMTSSSKIAKSPPLLCFSISPIAILNIMHFCLVLPLPVYLLPGMQAALRAGILSVLFPVGPLAWSPGPVTGTLSLYRCAACGEHWLFINRHWPRSSKPTAAPELLEATAQQEKGQSGGHDSLGQGGPLEAPALLGSQGAAHHPAPHSSLSSDGISRTGG